MERRSSKLRSMGFFKISMKFLIDRVPSCRILEFWVFGQIREQAKTADDHESQTQNNSCAETFPKSSYMSLSDSRNSSYADLNGSVGSISDLKPKGPGFESQIRQGYICWWRGSKRSGCVMNVSPCGFKVKEFALKFPKNLITN
jgi:hypothetical protein